MATGYKHHVVPVFLNFIFLCTLPVTEIYGLKAVSVSVPKTVFPGETVTLRCFYDLEGETLYSVKWYKGKQEFFRFVLKEFPHISTFPLRGVFVEVGLSSSDKVVLRRVKGESAGMYRCEVSTDAPFFYTEVVSSEMHVVYVPEGKPKISTDKASYHMGDILQSKCTSQPSIPAANLTWMLNDEKLNETVVNHYNDSNKVGHMVTEISVQFKVTGFIFQYGKAHLKCVATLFHLYEKEEEVILRQTYSSVGYSTELSSKHRIKYWTIPLMIVLLTVVR